MNRDDLSPAEQAHAARWAADWITRTVKNGGDWMDEHDIAGDISRMLLHRADQVTPPETVESLRAERDAAFAEMEEIGAAWRQEQIAHQATRSELRSGLAAGLRDEQA